MGHRTTHWEKRETNEGLADISDHKFKLASCGIAAELAGQAC